MKKKPQTNKSTAASYDKTDQLLLDSDELFLLLQTLIPETASLNPKTPASQNQFLNDKNPKSKKQLMKLLKVWETLLAHDEDANGMADKAIALAKEAEDNYNKNFATLLTAIRPLEQAYYTLASFFNNTKTTPRNVSILNADLEQLTDLDNTAFIDAVREELNANYDRLDLSENYSLLVVPGFLKSDMVLEKWAKIAHEYKALLVTDYLHLDAPDDVVSLFLKSNLAGEDAFKSNTIMTCNWLVGRGKYLEFSETDDLFVPPSAALGGLLYQSLISQVSAGTTHGVIRRAMGVRFRLKKHDLSTIEKIGLIPMCFENGKIIAYSSKTLCNGDSLGLQTYSVVRVFDYIIKVLMDFLNRRTFENFNAKTRTAIMTEIVLFLDDNVGPGKLIDSFAIHRFEQDAKDKTRIHLDLRMEPYFPAKNFMVKMNFESRNNDNKKWETSFEPASK